MLLFHSRDLIADDEDAFILLHASEIDDAIDLSDLSSIFWASRFEELSNPRQSADDIFRLDRTAWQTSWNPKQAKSTAVSAINKIRFGR